MKFSDSRKAQGAFEYVMVVGIAMLLIVPGAILFYNYSARSGDEMARARIEAAGNEIINTAEKVYYTGEHSWETIRLDIPENVRTMYVLDNSELVITYDSQVGTSQAVFFTEVNLTTPVDYQVGSMGFFSDEPHPGLNVIKITSMGEYVLINETR